MSASSEPSFTRPFGLTAHPRIARTSASRDGAAAGRLFCYTSQLGAALTWTHKRHRLTNGLSMGTLTETPSRPVGLLDQGNGEVYALYHSRDSHPYGWIGYKKATLAALLAAASDSAVFDVSAPRNTTVLINDESLDAAWNAKTPAHPVTGSMGGYAPVTSAVAASNAAGDAIWWARIAIASTMPTLSAATYVPGSITSSGFRPRITAS